MNLLNPGEFAAMGTLLCWTGSVLMFEAAGRRIGSMPVNIIRLAMAMVLFTGTLFVIRGGLIPLDLPAGAWFWMSISGLIGLLLGDLMLFRAFVEVGGRVAMLIMTLVPPITAIVAWVTLGEKLLVHQWLGMAITLAGVVWVVLERTERADARIEIDDAGAVKPRVRNHRPVTLRGVLLALGGAIGQSLGLVTTDLGTRAINQARGISTADGATSTMSMGDAMAATQIRVIAALLGFIVLFLVIGWFPRVIRALGRRDAMLLTAGGAVVGPFLGVTLLTFAICYTKTGIASTIVALVPITLIPMAILINKERVSPRAIVGTLISIAGVVLLIGI